MRAPSDNLDNLQSDIGTLAHLLAVIYDRSTEQEFAKPDGSRNTQADELSALAMIARDLAERVNASADACHTRVIADARAKKEVAVVSGAAFAEMCQAYDVALHDWRNELDRDADPAKEQELDAAFDALRGQIFDYRPASMAEVTEKAAFLSTRWNDAEGLTPNRIAQLFASLGAPEMDAG